MAALRFTVVLVALLVPLLCDSVRLRHDVRNNAVGTVTELDLSVRMDPSCNNGIKSKNICCPKSCGKCGGKKCKATSNQKGTLCCKKAIRKSGRACNNVGPPCKTAKGSQNGGGGGCKPSSTSGKWDIAPVNSGQLVARHEACAVMVNGLVVLLGGRGANKPVSIYNPKTKTWQTKNGPGPGVELHHTQCVTVGSQVYIVSSWKGGFPFEQNNDKIWIYNVAKDEWSTKNGLPANRLRGGGAAILKNGLIYVIAGNRGGHGAHATTLGWMDAYDIKNNKWITNLPNMPDGRDHVGGGLVNGELCVAGGRNGGVSGFFNAVVTSVYCYNTGNKKWTKKNNIPVGRAGSSYGVGCDGKLIVAGGEGNGQAYSRVDYFDGNSWGNPTFFVDSRHGSGVAVSNNCCCGHMFIPSGSGNIGGRPELFTTERFIPSGRPANCDNF